MPATLITRQQVIEEARSWIGTRFHHQGRVKRKGIGQGGCDCIGLVIGVWQALGLTLQEKPVQNYDICGYGTIPDGKRLQVALSQLLQEVAPSEAIEGDVVLFRFDTNPQHLGFLSYYPGGSQGIIHCYQAVGKVVEHRLDKKWERRIVGFYKGLGA